MPFRIRLRERTLQDVYLACINPGTVVHHHSAETDSGPTTGHYLSPIQHCCSPSRQNRQEFEIEWRGLRYFRKFVADHND